MVQQKSRLFQQLVGFQTFIDELSQTQLNLFTNSELIQLHYIHIEPIVENIIKEEVENAFEATGKSSPLSRSICVPTKYEKVGEDFAQKMCLYPELFQCLTTEPLAIKI